MSKVTFEFNEEEQHDVDLCNNRYKMACMLDEIQNYIRQLNKYEERAEIPTQEIVDKLTTLIENWYYIN